MHLKRNNAPKFWAVPRKGTKYLAVPMHNEKKAIPLVIASRDIIKIVKNAKELKKILNEKQVAVNNRIVRELNYPVSLFDVITFIGEKKNYKAIISKSKKLEFVEISDKEKLARAFKVINKKIIGKGKVQLNLDFGKNIISNEKVSTGDTVIVNMQDNSIIKVIPLEKSRTAYVMSGAHRGKEGKISEIVERGGKKIAKIISENKKINVWINNLIITE
ncbi:MAG: hypothetical protein ACP5OG_03345 [Candidatus Nanoarchaeia archaeon]